jgi:FkbM family methyltransferase
MQDSAEFRQLNHTSRKLGSVP